MGMTAGYEQTAARLHASSRPCSPRGALRALARGARTSDFAERADAEVLPQPVVPDALDGSHGPALRGVLD
jgi:hypothetical protein